MNTKVLKRKQTAKLMLDFAVTKDILKEVEMLAGRGLTQEQIHWYYGLKKDAWYAIVKKNPELRTSIRSGKAKTVSMVSGKLMELVKKGNLSAIIFYLKTQGRFSEKSSIRVTSDKKSKSFQELRITTTDPIEASKIYQQIMAGSM